MKEIKKVVAQLLKEGAESVKNIVVKNVTIKDMSNYTRVSLTLNKEVRQMVTNSGDRVESTSNVVFVSTYSIGAVLSNDENAAFAKNILMQSPELLTMVLSYADIDVLLEDVKKGVEYINPFSSKTEGRVIEQDSVFVHVVDIRLGKKGMEIVKMLQSKMLDSMLNGSFAKVAAGVTPKASEKKNNLHEVLSVVP